MSGLSVLNVRDGDNKLTFDPEKPIERERAARIVTDMLRRGYAIIIRVGGREHRVKEFDPNTCQYVIEGLSPEEEAEIARAMTGVSDPKKKRGRKAKVRVPAATTSGVAIARPARGCSPGSWA